MLTNIIFANSKLFFCFPILFFHHFEAEKIFTIVFGCYIEGEEVLLTYECAKCGRKIQAECEICCTSSVRRNVEKPPECCGQSMIEAMDDLQNY